MKPTIVTYEIGEGEDLSTVLINTKQEQIEFRRGNASLAFSTRAVDNILTVLQSYKKMIAMQPAPVGAVAPAPAPVSAPAATPVADPTLAPAAKTSAVQDIGDRDLYTQHLYVVRTADGRFFPRDVPTAGQMAQLTPDPAYARMFDLQQDAVDVARLYPGANIVPFRDVASYRIAIIGADGTVNLYAGPAQPPTGHPNGAVVLTGRTAAVETIKLIPLKSGERTALMPIIG